MVFIGGEVKKNNKNQEGQKLGENANLYLKLNLVTYLNKRAYTCFLVFNKSIEVLKRDLFFYKI